MNFLLIDDELYIVKGLKTILEKSDIQTDNIYEAKNGIEALRIINENSIDIIITDIKMPKMDGIEFMRNAREMGCDSSFIILSGFDEFDYAKKAIRYGAEAYLLKPINRLELIESIEKIVSNRIKNKNSNTEKREFKEALKNLKEYEMNFYLDNPSSGYVDIIGLFNSFNIEKFNNIQVSILFLHDSNIRRKKSPERLDKIKHFLSQGEVNVIAFYDSKGRIVIISDGEYSIDEFRNFLVKDMGVVCSIGTCLNCKSIDDVSDCYTMAKLALSKRFIVKDQLIFTYDHSDDCKDIVVNKKRFYQLREMIGTKRFEEIKEKTRCILDINLFADKNIYYFNEYMNNFFTNVIQYLCEFLPVGSNLRDKSVEVSSLDNFVSLEGYFEETVSILEKINDYFVDMIEEGNAHEEIKIALEYINNNYHEDISMEMVAEHVSLSYSYFSLMFSKEVKMKFVEYLRKIRIEKAKELLEQTNMKVYDISYKVGYYNVKNFRRVFKKQIGVSPLEYRNKWKAIIRNTDIGE